MADSTTSNISLTKPEVGASADSWGTKINTNFDTLDNLFTTGPALLITKGGTGATTASAARTNLGLGTVATESTVPVAKGGTGATSITSGALIKGAGTSAFSAASAADIVGQIGSTAVTNATNASTVTTVTTNQVLAAIASASVGDVGTYALVEYASAGNNTLNPGDVVSGSNLRYCGVQTHVSIGFNVLDAGSYGSTLSGSWRIMGYAESNNGTNGQPATLALRIS
jgi:hypothetical protein